MILNFYKQGPVMGNQNSDKLKLKIFDIDINKFAFLEPANKLTDKPKNNLRKLRQNYFESKKKYQSVILEIFAMNAKVTK